MTAIKFAALYVVHRSFSEVNPELIDLPNQDEQVLRCDLETLGEINRFFGARRAVARLFQSLAGSRESISLVDLASGYGDHGRNLIEQAKVRGQKVTVIAVDRQFQTLQISRQATAPDQKVFFVQADARHLPFRREGADLVFCSLALHHFNEQDAVKILSEMARVGRLGTACVDLVRSRLAAFAIWLLTEVIYREPMARHDARLSIHRAFTCDELKAFARESNWIDPRHQQFLFFQQAIFRIPVIRSTKESPKIFNEDPKRSISGPRWARDGTI